jgi:hypothetical protein
MPVGMASICNAADPFKRPFDGWQGLSEQALDDDSVCNIIMPTALTLPKNHERVDQAEQGPKQSTASCGPLRALAFEEHILYLGTRSRKPGRADRSFIHLLCTTHIVSTPPPGKRGSADRIQLGDGLALRISNTSKITPATQDTMKRREHHHHIHDGHNEAPPPRSRFDRDRGTVRISAGRLNGG